MADGLRLVLILVAWYVCPRSQVKAPYAVRAHVSVTLQGTSS